MSKILIGFFVGIIVILIGWFQFFEKPKVVSAYNDLRGLYDSLVVAKTNIDTIYDTIISERIVLKKEFVPVVSYDTVYLDKQYVANWYHETHSDSLVEIDFSILTFGEMKGFDYEYKLFRPTIHKNTITYVDRYVRVPERRVFVHGQFDSRLSMFGMGVTFVNKRDLMLSVGHFSFDQKTFVVFGAGVRVY